MTIPTTPHSERARQIAGKLSRTRRAALIEIGKAGVLGFGTSSLQARRWLIDNELSVRLPSEGFFTVVKERLTPLGQDVFAILQESPEQ